MVKNELWDRTRFSEDLVIVVAPHLKRQQLMYTSASIPVCNSLIPRLRREPGNEVNAVMCQNVV